MTEISIPGDPSGLAGLASQLWAAADHVGSVNGRLQSNSLQGAWSGNAAEAFRSTLHQLPGELTKVEQAFGDAGRAVGTFASTLEELQQRAAWYNGQLESARREMANAEAAKRSAESEVRAARQRGSAASDPVTKHAAQTALNDGVSMVGRAAADITSSGNRISSLERSATQLRDEYEQAVRTCCSALEGSGHAGHHSLLGWAKDTVKDIGKFSEKGAAAFIHTVKSGVDEVERVGGDTLEEFDKNWGDWRKFLVHANDVIGDVAVDVGVSVLVAAGAVALAVPGPGDVVAGAMVTADEALMAGASKLQAADRGLILAGDAVEGYAMGRSQYKAYLFDDAVETGVSIGGGKLLEGVGSKVESMPAFKKASGKLENFVKDDPTLKVGERIVVDEVKIVKDHVVDQGKDWVKDGIEALPKSLILEPLKEPETLLVNLAPTFTAR